MKNNFLIIIIAIALLVISISIFLFSLNGRYQAATPDNSMIILDTRTGTWYTASDKKAK